MTIIIPEWLVGIAAAGGVFYFSCLTYFWIKDRKNRRALDEVLLKTLLPGENDE